MKITFEEVLSEKEWLHKELMNSLTSDIITKAMEDRFYDVKLMINGEEVEPKLYNDIITNIDKYISEEAKLIVRDKLEEAFIKSNRLNEIINDVSEKIIDEFDLYENEDYQ